MKKRGNENKRHLLKIYPRYFTGVVEGSKKFELRKDDRDYKIGDEVIFQEWDDRGPTGKIASPITITYVLKDVPEFGLAEGFCIFCWRGTPELRFEEEE